MSYEDYDYLDGSNDWQDDDENDDDCQDYSEDEGSNDNDDDDCQNYSENEGSSGNDDDDCQDYSEDEGSNDNDDDDCQDYSEDEGSNDNDDDGCQNYSEDEGSSGNDDDDCQDYSEDEGSNDNDDDDCQDYSEDEGSNDNDDDDCQDYSEDEGSNDNDDDDCQDYSEDEGSSGNDDDDEPVSVGDADNSYDSDDNDENIKSSTKAKKNKLPKEESTAKSGSRKRKSKTKTSRPNKKQKVESNSKVPQKSNKKLRKNKKFSDKNKKSSNKSRKKRPLVKISPAAIRKFSAKYVKIPKTRMKWARKMVNTHIEFIREHCKTHDAKGIFSHFEFTGSFYEHLKTENANELDILVALDTKNNADLMVEEVDDVPGYALIKVTKKSSKYWQFVDDNEARYVDPKKCRNWFFGQVQKAVNECADKKKQEKDPAELKLLGNGPATTLLIEDKENDSELRVDLVPAFLFKPKKDPSSTKPVKGRRYVAKPPEEIKADGFKFPREMLWRRSFSFEEKKEMEKMDAKDSGCRHEVVKVIKTIRNKDGPPLNLLSSYHIKTAFLHYNSDKKSDENLEWSREHLAERFLGLMDYLRERISKKKLSHFFINELNLLQELSQSALDNIENRLSKLISNEKELKKVLMQGEKSAKNVSRRKHKKRKVK